VEWFIDHARLEPLLADGVPEVRDGVLATGRGAGHGMRLADSAGKFSVDGAGRR
jgi:hypothetical protein